jgi:Xaa-Pro dipeptidase
MKWGQSERPFGVVIPAKGELVYICPKFEEDRAKELIQTEFGTEIRCWEEHESPYALIVGAVKDRGVQFRKIGMEESRKSLLQIIYSLKYLIIKIL